LQLTPYYFYFKMKVITSIIFLKESVNIINEIFLLFYQKESKLVRSGWKGLIFLDTTILENIHDLDEIDRKILTLLSENARMSYVDIGEVVGLSRVAVKNRVLALEQRGVIEKYTVIINPQKISRTISAYFEIAITPSSYDDVVELLLKNHYITKIYQVTGSSKFHIHAILNDEAEMDDLLKNVIYKLPGLQDIYVNVILTRIKDVKNIRL